MYCINLDTINKKAFVPIKRKGVVGSELVDAESPRGKKWIQGMIGKRVVVVFRGSDDPLFEFTVRGNFTYDSLMKKRS